MTQKEGEKVEETKTRYEYLKTMSSFVTDKLEEEKFAVSKKELDVFFELLKLELQYKYNF